MGSTKKREQARSNKEKNGKAIRDLAFGFSCLFSLLCLVLDKKRREPIARVI